MWKKRVIYETRKGFEKYFQKLFNNNIFKTSLEDQEIYKKKWN